LLFVVERNLFPMTPKQRLLALTLTLALFLGGLAAPHTAAHAQAPAYRTTQSSWVASIALSYVGYRYASYGDTPWYGFSCVGLVHWAYARAGRYAPENVSALYTNYDHLSWTQVRPGDVLLFANTVHWGLSHAAIYIGGGLMVGADNFSVGVHIDRVWDGYWGPRFVAAVRP
jgi:cell wall-associated NlpC family hydrolase